MRTTFRMLLLGLVGAVALSTAGTALAAYKSPQLRVTDDRTSVTIRYTVAAADDPTAKLTFYAPTGYTATLNQPAGTTLGTVTAQGTAADLGGALLPLTGTVQARAASGDVHVRARRRPPTPLTQRDAVHGHRDAHRLLGPDPAGGRPDARAAGLRRLPRRGAGASAFATASIQACLPPPDVPTGTPGRATLRLQADAGRLQGERRLHERRHRPAPLARAGDAVHARTRAARTPPAPSRRSR